MEVHHHPQVEKKNFKEYFLEFIMIFLAVTMGFFAENIREIFKDRENVHQLSVSLMNALKIDTAHLTFYLQKSKTKIKQIDSLYDLLQQPADKKPDEVKMDSAQLDSAVSFAVHNDSKTNYNLRIADMEAYKGEPDYRILGPMKDRGKPAGLIIRNGYIVAEWGDVKRVDMTFSATKSYLSTMAGLAVDSRLIKSVDDYVNEYVTDNTFDGPHNAKITWRHLLTQSSDWSGCLFDIYDWADRPVPREGTIDDWKNRAIFEPGTHFKYNDVRVNLLAYSLLQVWRKPLPMILKEKIMDPIGASTTWRWYGYSKSFVNMDGIMMQSVSGGGHFGGGLFINTLDHARYGLLFLRKGRWKNEQLISEKWVKAVQEPSVANKSYGFIWWLNDDNMYKDIPRSIYMADGFGGNFIVVDNEHDLVIVARWLEPSKLDEFLKLVIASVKK